MNDMLGRKIFVGDALAYAMRKGNSSEIAVGVVIEDDTGKGVKVRSVRCPWWGSKWDVKESRWNNAHNAVLLVFDQLPQEIKALLKP